MIFTTSWDDGAALDIKIANLLEQYDCTGTFYVCPKKKPYYGDQLNEEGIRELNNKHEVGAHSITHPHLSELPEDEAQKEINESKLWIENITGVTCKMFCYPYGDFSSRTAKLVEEVGFAGARTTEQWRFETEDPYMLGTSLHIYPFPLRPIPSRRVFDPIRKSWLPLRSYKTSPINMRGWLPMAKSLFLRALKEKKSWFHLWGHSWEVEKFRMWKHLEKFLAFVREHDGIDHATNSNTI